MVGLQEPKGFDVAEALPSVDYQVDAMLARQLLASALPNRFSIRLRRPAAVLSNTYRVWSGEVMITSPPATVIVSKLPRRGVQVEPRSPNGTRPPSARCQVVIPVVSKVRCSTRDGIEYAPDPKRVQSIVSTRPLSRSWS